MNEHFTADAVGSLAGLLTTIAYVPQVAKTWRSKRASDLSLSMLLILTTGVALWLAYGLLIGALPVIIANGVTLLLAAAMLVMRVRYRANRC